MDQEYDYSPIKNMTEGYNNFYGVIYDASFPIQEIEPTKFSCFIKVIDPETNMLSSGSEHFIDVVVKTKDKSMLPYIHTLGDVIRIHRGHLVSI
jgi:hypothetical protein